VDSQAAQRVALATHPAVKECRLWLLWNNHGVTQATHARGQATLVSCLSYLMDCSEIKLHPRSTAPHMRKAAIPEGHLPNAPPAPQTDADKNTKQVHRGKTPAAPAVFGCGLGHQNIGRMFDVFIDDHFSWDCTDPSCDQVAGAGETTFFSRFPSFYILLGSSARSQFFPGGRTAICHRPFGGDTTRNIIEN
jgi:hypothetical protein